MESHTTVITPTKLKHNVSQQNTIPIFLEMTIVFLLALGLSCWHVFFSGAPILTLLFDSQGYFAAAQQLSYFCTHYLGPSITYFLSGCPESQRLLLASQLAKSGCLELLKTGPLIPATIGTIYGIAHKTMVFSNWAVGALGMIVVQSMSVVFIWATASRLWNRSVARIAAVLTLSYLPIIGNSGRLLSEIVSLCSITFFIFIATHKPQTTLLVGRLPKSGRDIFLGIAWGAASVMMMLSRPMLMLLPILLICINRSMKLISKRSTSIAILTIVLLLAPWCAFRKIATGNFSVSVDRYLGYNLYSGWDIKADGWDTVPGKFVQQPDSFHNTVSDVISVIIHNLETNPCQFGSLLACKFSRLLDSPWNDFQTTILGIPWLLQVWLHQLLLLLAIVGMLVFNKVTPKENSQVSNTASIITLLSVLAYHLLSFAFITMRRYFFTATPAIILLSALAIYWLWQQKSLRAAALMLLACLPPTVLAITDVFCRDVSPLLPRLMVRVGAEPTLLVVTFTFCLTLIAFFVTVAFLLDLPLRRKILYATLASVCIAISGSTLCIRLCSLSYSVSLASPLTVHIQVPRNENASRWLLLMDLGSSQDSFEDPFRLVKVEFNGQTIMTTPKPLFLADKRFREILLDEVSFAYSANYAPQLIHQWFYLELPSNMVHVGSNTACVMDRQSQNTYLSCDLPTPLFRHKLSLDKFSWTKGFFVHSNGDMRLDEWDGIPFKPHTYQPRVILMALQNEVVHPCIVKEKQHKAYKDLSSPADWIEPHKGDAQPGFYKQHRPYASELSNALVKCTINLPSSKLDQKNKSASYQLTTTQLGPVLQTTPSALHIQVTAEYKTSADRDASPSICLIENSQAFLNSSTQYAPLAPLRLPQSVNWRTVKFEDVVPLKPNRAPSDIKLRLLCSLRNWWEVLDYALYKGKGSAEFRNIKLELKATNLADTTKTNRTIFYCQPLELF